MKVAILCMCFSLPLEVTMAELEQKIRDGFQSSALRGVTGAMFPSEKDDAVSQNGLRFAQMISNKLEPFPRANAALTAGSNFSQTNTNHKTICFRDTSYAQPKSVEHPSTTGLVPNGLRDSRGFLETATTSQRQAGRFDDSVMKVVREGNEKEKLIEEKRIAVQSAPFNSVDPNPWKKSTQEHSNLSNVDESAYRTQYCSRHNLLASKSAKAAEVQTKLLQGNTVDRDALAEHMKKMHELTMPKGYKAPSGAQWQTSTHEHFASYDIRDAALANTVTATNPPRRAADSIALPPRNSGFETESSAAFQVRATEHPTETKFRSSNVLDIKNGAFCMNHKFHHPRSDVQTGAVYKPSQIVQGQYCPMSSVSVPASNS